MFHLHLHLKIVKFRGLSTEVSLADTGRKVSHIRSKHAAACNIANWPPAQPPVWTSPVENQTLQTQYNPLHSSEQSHLARNHRYGHQLMHLLEKVAVRLVWSILLSGAMVGCFKYFENVKILNDLEKNVFNVLSTMIYLTMGLNLAVGLPPICP